MTSSVQAMEREESLWQYKPEKNVSLTLSENSGRIEQKQSPILSAEECIKTLHLDMLYTLFSYLDMTKVNPT